ncbi:MAG: hypothetical protein OET21_04035 [Desulfobacterales bacterium]|jgi:hypothetical protein|nr:hypothetical protein [Desulfobacteraceae bacterium]MDH3826559.1 hypothetical protein [Desulfobacterales bacterium]MDH3837403.1 hypothetical protein [Desulfobacteraceae bacterium]MDH3878615.1 hypothetical protein [Desulfobacterales bacterium]
MNDSDKEFLSRFSLDPLIEYSFEDIDGSDLSYYDEIKPLDDENILGSEDLIVEDDFLFDN